MKVIELLTKIANGEETHFDTKLNDKSVSVRYYNDRNFSSSTDPEMLTIADIIKSLNDEVEVTEEDKKIEKLNTKDLFACDHNIRVYFAFTWSKINEIIDYINGGTNGE